MVIVFKAIASYVVTVLVCSLISTAAYAQTADILPLLSQEIVCPSELPEGLENELKECFMVKTPGKMPVLKVAYKKLFKKDVSVWEQEALDKSAFKLNQKLKQKGYLNSSVQLVKNQTSKIGDIAEFHIQLGNRWRIGEIVWSSLNAGISKDKILENSLIESGDFLDVDFLEDERERISNRCQNLGFATFNEGFIHFELDTANAQGYANLEVFLRGQKLEGQTDFVRHKKMSLGSIFFDQSLMYKPINSKVLRYLVMFKEGEVYDPFIFESTYRRLSSVSAISSVQLAKDYPSEGVADLGVVDVTVTLKSATRYNFSFSLDMTRADTRFGPLTKLTWKNRNLLGKGDVFTWTTTAAYASTQLFSNDDINILPNTGELGIQISYRTIGFPFVSIENLPKSTYSHSEFILNSAVESRPEYNRSFTNFLYRVDWTENLNRYSKIIVDPIRLSYVKIETSSDFDQWLEDYSDPITQYRFSDYANLGSSLSWSQASKSKILATVEWSGMLSSLISPVLGLDTNASGGVEINNVPLIKYFRLEGSWSKTHQLKSNENDKLAFRVRAGSAWVGKGTDALPFDRAFYGGGANGVRGWPIRGLGGGSDLVGVGDLRFDASLEHRKSITDNLSIASFADLGNVWVHDSPNKLKDLALSAGIGFRYDLEFFLFRIDGAIRLHDPTQNQGLRWIAQGPLGGGVHFGLGHPF